MLFKGRNIRNVIIAVEATHSQPRNNNKDLDASAEEQDLSTFSCFLTVKILPIALCEISKVVKSHHNGDKLTSRSWRVEITDDEDVAWLTVQRRNGTRKLLK